METLREIWEYDRKSIDNASTIREWYGHWIVDDGGIDNTYIVYMLPHTIEEKEQFKDITDTGNEVLIPYIRNSGLSAIREFPIDIRNKYHKHIAYRICDCNGFIKYTEAKMRYILSDYNILDTIREYCYIENKTLRRFILIESW